MKVEAKATLEMELTDYMANLIREAFNIEVEMLQGYIGKLPDGRNHYKIEISEEKGEPILKFMLMTISKSDKLNLN